MTILDKLISWVARKRNQDDQTEAKNVQGNKFNVATLTQLSEDSLCIILTYLDILDKTQRIPKVSKVFNNAVRQPASWVSLRFDDQTPWISQVKDDYLTRWKYATVDLTISAFSLVNEDHFGFLTNRMPITVSKLRMVDCQHRYSYYIGDLLKFLSRAVLHTLEVGCWICLHRLKHCDLSAVESVIIRADDNTASLFPKEAILMQCSALKTLKINNILWDSLYKLIAVIKQNVLPNLEALEITPKWLTKKELNWMLRWMKNQPSLRSMKVRYCCCNCNQSQKEHERVTIIVTVERQSAKKVVCRVRLDGVNENNGSCELVQLDIVR